MHNEQQQKENDFDMQREKIIKDKKELIDHINREFNDKVRMIEKRNQVFGFQIYFLNLNFAECI